MQIRMMDTGNAMRVAAGSISARRAGQQDTGSVFGPQCRVTISKEGRRLNAQASQSGQVERLLLRQQKQSEDYKEEYQHILDDINSLKKAVDSVGATEDKDTIAKKQDALRRMGELKAKQEEENEKMLKDAASKIAGVSKEQEKIDKENAQLYVMLKSFEERDGDEDGGGHGADSSEAEPDGAGGIGKEVQESASAFGVAAARRKMEALGVIGELDDEGSSLLFEVQGMVNDIDAMLDDARAAMTDDTLSDAEKLKSVAQAGERVRAAAQAGYGEMARMQAKGLQLRRDARELSLRHIKEDPLENVSDVQRSVMDIGVTAAFSEVGQAAVEKASQELEERVQDAIDDRNEAGIAPEGDEEEEKRAEELEQEKIEKEEREEEQRGQYGSMMVQKDEISPEKP